MAERLPNVVGVESRRWIRDWHDYANYQVVHERHVDALVREGIIVRDTIRFLETADADNHLVKVNVRGRLITASGAVIVVNKWLGIRRSGQNRTEVLTSEYMYHAFVRARRRQDMFRYDSCHGIETLHCHRFDADGDVAGIEDVTLEQMPPLSVVIREAEELAAWLRGR